MRNGEARHAFRNFARDGAVLCAEICAMANQPREPKKAPASKAGLKDGKGAPPPQSDPKHGGAKRPVEEEDVYSGAERMRDRRISSEKAKP
jgi:hypothetical protein